MTTTNTAPETTMTDPTSTQSSQLAAALLKATIYERGNGLPDVGEYAVDDGGGLWRIVELVGQIHTGSGGSSVRALVESAPWADLDDDDDPQCGCVTALDNDPTE